MAASLLKYANREKVAQALTERGYPVTRMSVNRWARGNEMPEIAARMIAELFGHTGHEEAAPPKWAERLADETARKVIEALAPADVQRAAAAVIARLEGTPQPDDEDPLDSDDGTDQDGLETPERVRE